MYATLKLVEDELRQTELQANTVDDTWHQSVIVDALRFVTDRIISETGRYFEPVAETRYFHALPINKGGEIVKNRLWLNRPLFSLTSITIEDTVLTASQYLLLPKGDLHSEAVLFLDSTWCVVSQPYDAIAIDGIWAFKDQHRTGWKAVGATVGDATDIETVLTLTPNTGSLSPGHLIQVGSEMMTVESVDAANNRITVARGENGTTEAAITGSPSVSRWQPDTRIEQAARRWATMLYQRRAQFHKTEVDGVGVVQEFPKDMPTDVSAMLGKSPFKRIGNIRAM